MKDRRGPCCCLLLFILGTSLLAPLTSAGSVTDSLMEKLKGQGKTDAVLELPSIMSSVLANPMMSFLSGDAKTSMMTTLMKQFTTAAQAPFMSAIKNLGFAESVEPFFVTNKLSIKNANLPLVQALSKLPGPFTIRQPEKVDLVRAVSIREISNITKRAGTIQWGVKKIEAPAVWESTTRGENVWVAGIDTGVFDGHDALAGNYGGKFYDGMNDEETRPYDDDGHGTHTMGTIAGANGFGVAPGSTWMACKGLGPQGGDDRTLSRCAQWILEQRPLPVAVCNSWGGGQAQKFFNDEIAAWQEANIVPVFAVGNSGSGCTTAGSPGDQPNLISVGATDSSDKIASFSSRGYAKGTRNYKPEVSAPGVKILSAFNKSKDSYAELQGTSMAAPHVTGAVALMRSANPDMCFKDILSKLESTAVRPTLSSSDTRCGKANGNWPNNAFGYGRINVRKAMA